MIQLFPIVIFVRWSTLALLVIFVPLILPSFHLVVSFHGFRIAANLLHQYASGDSISFIATHLDVHGRGWLVAPHGEGP